MTSWRQNPRLGRRGSRSQRCTSLGWSQAPALPHGLWRRPLTSRHSDVKLDGEADQHESGKPQCPTSTPSASVVASPKIRNRSATAPWPARYWPPPPDSFVIGRGSARRAVRLEIQSGRPDLNRGPLV